MVTPKSVDEVGKYLEQAYASRERNDLEDALRESEFVIQLDSDCAEAHNLRGLVLEELGRKGEALAAYRTACRLDSTFQDAQDNFLELEQELRESPVESEIDSQNDKSRSDAVGKEFGIRAAAYTMDSIAHYILILAATSVGGFFLGILMRSTGRAVRFDEAVLEWAYVLVGITIALVYFPIFEWLYGATLGKVVLRMRVIRMDGEPCGLGAALIRHLARYIDAFFFAIPAYASMKHPLYQRIGDKWAKTIVVSSKNPIIRNPRPWRWFVLATGLYFVLTIFLQFLAAIVALH